MAFPFAARAVGSRLVGLQALSGDLGSRNKRGRWCSGRAGGVGGSSTRRGGAAKAAGRFAGSKVHFETLEPRYLLSADLMPFAVDMLDPSIGNDLTLRLDSATNTLQVIDNRDAAAPAVVSEQALDATSEVVVTGTDLDDQLTLDLSNPFSLAGGISFAGGAGNDALAITNGVLESVRYAASGSDTGSVELSDAAGTTAVSYSGLESVSDSLQAAGRSFANETGLGQGITLGNDGDPGNGLISLGGSGLTALAFANPGSSLTIALGDQGDNVTLGALDAGFGAALTVQGGLGADSLQGADGANLWHVTGSDAGTLAGATDASFSGIESLVGGAGDDSFTLAGGTLSGTLEGGAGADQLQGDDGTNDWRVTGADAGTVSGVGGGFSAISTLLGGLAEDLFEFAGGSLSGSVLGGGGTDTLDYSAATAGVSVDLAAGTASGAGGVGEVENVTGGAGSDVLAGDAGDNVLIGRAGDDIFSGGGGTDSFLGGAGSDTLLGGDGDNVWNITGLDQGTLNTSTFAEIENLTGGTGDDTFFFAIGGSISGTIQGGGGINTLDYSAQTSSVTVDLEAGAASDTGLVAGIQNVTGGSGADSLAGDGGANVLSGGLGDDLLIASGGADTLAAGGGSDTLKGLDGDAVWTITLSDAGTLGMAGFFDVESLLGGGGADRFAFAEDGVISGTIDGGGGENTLDYGATATAVMVNLAVGLASRTAIVRNIRHAVGGSGDDELIGDDLTNQLWGGDGDDRLTGGGGADSFEGGAGTDTLTGPAGNSTWTLTGSDAGTLNDAGFSGIENLEGAADNEDTFVVAPGGSLSGLMDGGAGGFDSVVIDGGSYASVTFSASGPDSGTVDLDGSVITYAGLEPLDLLPFADGIGNVVISAIDVSTLFGGDDLVLENNATSGMMTLRSLNGTMETINFANPTTSLTINMGLGDDRLTIASLDPGFGAALFINGQAGSDEVIVDTDVMLPGEVINIDAEIITVEANRTISTLGGGAPGNITLSGAEIELRSGSLVLASGDVLIEAEAVDLLTPADLLFFKNKNAFASIQLLDATVTGENVTISAHSDTSKVTTPLDDPFTEALSDAGLFRFSGLAGQSVSESTAIVNVGADTVIGAAADVTITARADSESLLTTFGFIVGVGFVESRATADAWIDGTAQVTAGGALTLQAITDNRAENEVLSGLAPIDVTLAQSDIFSLSNAYIAQGATISATSIDVLAENTNSVMTSAQPLEIADTFIGGAWASVQLHSEANAHVDTNVNIPGGLTITARSITVDNDLSASSDPADTGDNDPAEAPGTAPSPEPDEESNASALDFSASLSFADSLNLANAYIGADAVVSSGSDIAITAETEDNFQIFATSSADEATTALSTSLTDGSYRNEANAYIGEWADVAAQGALDVVATTTVPNQLDLLSILTGPFTPAEVWDAIKTAAIDLQFNQEGILTQGIFTTYVRSAGSADGGFGFAGSLNFLAVESTANAYIGEGARINQAGQTPSVDQTVSVRADTIVDTINLIGVFSLNFDPGDDEFVVSGGTSGKASLGGAYNQIDYNTASRAFIADDAVVSAAQDVIVEATSTENAFIVTLPGGEADKFGISGAFGLFNRTNETLAFIDDRAVVGAGRDVAVRATEALKEINISGAVISGANFGFGFNVSLNEVVGSTRAFIGNKVGWDDLFVGPQDGVILGDVLANDSTPAGGTLVVTNPGTALETSEGGSVVLNADGTFTYTPDAGFTGEDSFVYFVEDGKGGADSATVTLRVSAADMVDDAPVALRDNFVGTVDGAVAGDVLANDSDPEGGSLSILASSVMSERGGSVLMNADGTFTYTPALGFTGIDRFSYIVIDDQGQTATATVTIAVDAPAGTVTAASQVDVTASTTNKIAAYSLATAKTSASGGSSTGQSSGTGSFGIQFSGDASVNRITGETLAAITGGVTVTPGLALNVTATDTSEIDAIAGSAAIAGGMNSVGIAGSYAQNTIDTTTMAVISNATISSLIPASPADVTLSAQTLGDIFSITAGANKAGKGGLAGSVSKNDLIGVTEASVEDATIDTGSLGLDAADERDIFAVAGALSFGGKASFGASVALNTITNTVDAYVLDSDVLSSGDQTLSARTENEIQSITAAISGSGGLSFLVAAGAVSVNTITNQTSASISGRKSLGNQAGGSVSLMAGDQSQIFSIAGGVGGTSGSGGFGGAASTNFVTNTTSAEIGDTAIVSATDGISVTATSLTDIDSIAIGGAVANKVGVALSTSINEITNTTRASIGGAVVLSADGSILVGADDGVDLLSVAGNISVGLGLAALGLSNSTLITNNTVEAMIGAGADVTALGNGEGLIKFTGERDAAGNRLTETFKGLAVAATSFEDVETAAAGGSLGGTAGVSGSAPVTTMAETTRASIGEGAQINASSMGTAAAVQSVHVLAWDDTKMLGIAGSVAGATGAVGFGAAADVTGITKITEAFIADTTTGMPPASVNAARDVTVRALSGEDFFSVAASIGAASTAGIAGAASVYTPTLTTQAFVGQGVEVFSNGNVLVAADDDTKFEIIDGTITGAATAAVGVANSTVVMDKLVDAYVGQDAIVTALGIGPGMEIFDAAGNPDGSVVAEVVQGLSVVATSFEDFLTIAVGGAGAGTAAIGGSVAVNVLNMTTLAHLDEGAQINTLGTGNLGQSVYVLAVDDTVLTGAAGRLSIGGAVGFGAGADVATITKLTEAFIADMTGTTPATVNAERDVKVQAFSSEDMLSVTAAVNFGGSVSIPITASVYTLDLTTGAYIGQDAQVHAGGSVLVAADNTTEIDIISGSAGVGGAAAVGASAAVTVIDETTFALIADGAVVDALGNAAAITAKTGNYGIDFVPDPANDGEVAAPQTNNSDADDPSLTMQRTAAAETRPIKGVAVTATNKDDIETIAVSAGGSGSVAVQVIGSVNVTTSNTSASIADNARVNRNDPGAGSEQSVLVAAGSDFYHLGVATGLSISGAGSAVPASDVTVLSNTTTASIGSFAVVEAERDVSVLAGAREDILSISGGIGGSGGIAVTGAVSVIDVTSQTHAVIGSDALVLAGDNVLVSASDETDSDMIVGTAAVGLGGGGLGGSVGVTSITKDTLAEVGDRAVVDALGNGLNQIQVFAGDVSGMGFATETMTGLAVQAQSSEDVFTVTVAGAGGFFGGVAGAVSVEVIESDTTALIGAGAIINQSGLAADAAQGVNVSAVNDTQVFVVDGAIGLAIFGGLGGAVDVGVIRNDTQAAIATGAMVGAAQDVEVHALSNKEVDVLAISGAAGVVGIAGSVSVFTIGAELDQASKDSLEANDGSSNNTSTYADDEAGSTRVSGPLGGYDTTDTNGPGDDTPDNTQLAGEGITGAGTTVSGATPNMGVDAAVNSMAPPPGTVASIEANATVDAGRDVAVKAKERLVTDLAAGAGAIGLGGGGGAVAIANIRGTAQASIGSMAHVSAGGDVEIKAALEATTNVDSFSGTLGLVGLGASVAIINDSSVVAAFLDDGAEIITASVVNIGAESIRTANAGGFGINVAAGAVGVSEARVNLGGLTTAFVGAAVQIGQDPMMGSVGDLVVDASDTVTATADTIAGGGGIVTGSGAESRITVDPTVRAFIDQGAMIDVTGDVTVEARSEAGASADALGISIGALAVGVSLANAMIAPTLAAFIAPMANVSAGGKIRLQSRHNVDEFGVALNREAFAHTLSGSGSFAGGVGSNAEAMSSASLDTYVGAGAILTLGTGLPLVQGQDVTITSLASNKATADADSFIIGFGLGVGTSFATATADGTTLSHLDGTVAAAHDLVIEAQGASDATASADASGGGLFAGTGTDVNANASPTVRALLNPGADAMVSNDLRITAESTATADADAEGLVIGGLAIGANFADAVVGGTTRAAVEAGMTPGPALQIGRDLVIDAESLAVGDAFARASAGGLAAGAGAQAVSDVMPTVEAALNRSVVSARDVMLAARAEVHSTADAEGVAVSGLLSAGGSTAIAKANPTITASVGNDAVISADQDIGIGAFMNVDDTGNPVIGFAAQADSFGSAGALLIGIQAGAKSTAESKPTVTTRLGDRATLDALHDVTLESRAHDSVMGMALGNTDGLISVGGGSGTETSIDIDTQVDTILGADAVIQARHDITLASMAESVVVATVMGSSGQDIGGFFSGLFGSGNPGGIPSIVAVGGAAIGVEVFNTATTAIGAGAEVTADNRIDIKAEAMVTVMTSAVMESASVFIADAVSASSVFIDSDAFVLIGGNAVIEGADVDMLALNEIDATSFASAQVTANLAAGFGTAASQLLIGTAANKSQARVLIGSGARVIGSSSLSLEALNNQKTATLLSRARVTAFGALTSTATAETTGSVYVGADVESQIGSEIRSSNLTVHSESDYTLQRDPQSSADTVVSTLVQQSRNVVRKITKWLPWPLNKIVEFITDTIFFFVEIFDFSDTNNTVAGVGVKIDDTINLNGGIFNTSTQKLQVIARDDGMGVVFVTDAGFMPLSAQSNIDFDGDGNLDIVIDPIINDETVSMNFEVPRGRVIGSAIVNLNKIIPEIEIINETDRDLFIKRVDMVNVSGELDVPDISYRSDTALSGNLGDYNFTTDLVESELTISNLGSGDIYFTKSISNVSGMFDISNAHGSILASNPNVVLESGDAGGLMFSAPEGQVGSSTNPLTLRLVVGKTNLDGTAATMLAMLDVLAGGDIFVDLTGILYTFAAPVPGAVEVVDRLQLDLESLGGNISVLARQGSVFQTETTETVVGSLDIPLPGQEDASGGIVGITSTSALRFADNGAGPDTITRIEGSWFADGFEAGQTISVTGSLVNDGSYEIDTISLDGKTLTLVAADDLLASTTGLLSGDPDITFTDEVVAAPTGNPALVFADNYVAELTGTPTLNFLQSYTASLTGTATISFRDNDTAPDSVERSVGSWRDDGFAEGRLFEVTGSVSNDGTYRVESISMDGFVMTLALDAVLVAEMIDAPAVALFGMGQDAILRSAGSWVDDGFLIGQFIQVDGTVANNGSHQIVGVSADGRELVLATSDVLTVEDVSAPTATVIVPDMPLADTITRSSGSWAADGFVAGQLLRISGTLFNNGTFVIADVSGDVLTLDADALSDETVAMGARVVVEAPDTITRSAGLWTDDGFAEGQTIQVSGATANDGAYRIAAISPDGTRLTLEDGQFLTDEGPATGINVARFEAGVFVQVGGTQTIDVVETETVDVASLAMAVYGFDSVIARTGNVMLDVTGDAALGQISAIMGAASVSATEAIRDANADGLADLIATNVSLTADTGGIGSAVNAIQTDLVGSQLDATAVGDIFLQEIAGDMKIGEITSSAGNVTLTADGSILDVLDDSASDVNGQIVTLTAQNGDIGAAGNSLDIDSTQLTAAAQGDIHVTEVTGDLNLALANAASGDVRLVAAAGSILDALAGTASNILGVDIDLTAQGGGIGAAGNRLEIDSATVAPGILTATAAQDIFLEEATGDLTLGSIVSTSMSGIVDLTTPGAILDDDLTGAPDVVASAAILRAMSGIGEMDNALDTVLSNIEADAGMGGIWVDNDGALTVGDVFAGGPIVLTTFSPLTVVANMTSLSSILLQATDSLMPGDDLTIQSGVTVQALGGSVDLLAGDKLIIEAGSTVRASALSGLQPINIALDQISGDFGGSIQIFGTLIGSTALVSGDEGDNVIAIANVTAGTPTIVQTFGGSDTVNVGSNATLVSNTGGTVEDIADLLTIDAGGDLMDKVNVDDSGENMANTGLLTGGTLTGLGMAVGINYSGVEALSIALGSGGDTFTIESTHAGTTMLDAGAGADTVNIRSIGGNTTVDGGGGGDTVNVGSLAPATGGTLNGLAALLEIRGGQGSDTVNLDDIGEMDDNVGTLTGSLLTGLGTAGIGYQDVETLNIELGSGDDVFNVQGTSAVTNLNLNDGNDTTNVGSIATQASNSGGNVDGIGALLTVDGGNATGSDLLTVDDTVDTYTNTGALTATTITGLGMAGSIAYVGLEDLVIALGDGGDIFTIESTHAAPTTLNTRSGADSINVRSIAGETTVDTGIGGDTITVGSPAGLVDGINAVLDVVADDGDDTLNVDDSGDPSDNTGALTALSITGLDMTDGRIDYSGIEGLGILLGGGGDTFTIESTHATLTTLDARDGGDEINVQSIAGLTTVNAGAGGDTVNLGSAAPGMGGVLNGLNALLTLEGEGDDDTLNVDNSGDEMGDVGTLTGTSITGLGTSGIDYGTFETLNINLGTGHDRFNVHGTSPVTNIDAGWGDDLIYVSSGADLEALDGLAGNGGDLEALHQDILHGTLDFIAGELNIDAGGGHNTLSVSDRDDLTGDTATITDGAITGLSLADINYVAIGGDFSGQGFWTRQADVGLFGRGINIYAGSVGNFLTIGSIHQTPMMMTPFGKTITTVFAGEGDDTVTANVLDTADALLAIRGQGGEDTVNASASTHPVIVFGDGSSVELGGDDITGGTGADVIFGDGGRVTYLLPDGGMDFDIVLGGALGTLAAGLNKDSDFNTADLIRTVDGSDDGDDQILGNGGDDVLMGGYGADTIDGNTGRDLILGDAARLDRQLDSLGFTDVTNPRFRALSGQTIYGTGLDGNGEGEVLIDRLSQFTDPRGVAAWADFDLTLLDGAVFLALASDNADFLAGGADDDTIFGQEGNDTIQGDGSTDVPVPMTGASVEAADDGDDYIEGNGGSDLIFGNLGRDDIVGGSSSLFGLNGSNLPADGADTIFGGSGNSIAHNDPGNISDQGHARDSDVIAGDNANIYRLVGINGSEGGDFLTFNYDNYTNDLPPEQQLKLIPRAVELLSYTPGGSDLNGGSVDDNGAGDEIHGEAGDDLIFGMAGDDILFGDGQDDDIIGGYGNDWISAGTGTDGVLGDDGLIFTSRNMQQPNGNGDPEFSEPLYGVLKLDEVNQVIATPGDILEATINPNGELKKTVDLFAFSVNPSQVIFDKLVDVSTNSNDVIYGGWDDDFLHGGAGDDAISGAEALEWFFDTPGNNGDELRFDDTTGEFADFDEFDPRGKINGFLLNFSANEGSTEANGTLSDGDDAIFGDTGNDWLVGGTGRDRLYGGAGLDLLNADDDHDTVGGNDTPDPDPTYADIAFGGGGRDILIANTGGDRLVDWLGAFNTYIVPFAPFGAFTITRNFQPQLGEFLLDLSQGDGADQTLILDGEPARFGEPFGELNLVEPQDPVWQEQTGAPTEPIVGNVAGGARDVLSATDFNAGDLTAFAADSGTWTVDVGRLQVAPEFLGGDAVSVFHVEDPLPSYFEILATVSAEKDKAGFKSNAFLIFDYQSPTDFKFAGINAAIDKIQMGHRTAEGWIVDEQTPVQIWHNRAYYLTLALHGTTATLVVNGSEYFSHTYDARVINGYSYGLNSGMVGVGAENSIGFFDNVVVQVLPPEITFEQTEDFADGLADLFVGGQSGSWQVAGDRYTGAPATGSDRSVSIFDPGVTLGLEPGAFQLAPASVLDLEATLNVEVAGGVAFDYVNAERFKFAAIRADSNQVIIGHYTERSGWVVDAAADRTIEAGQDYDLEVSLKGTAVSVSLDGQTVLSHAFNAVVVDGGFGLLSIDGASAFDQVTVKTNDPAFRVESDAALRASAPAGSTGTAQTVTTADLQAILDEAIRRLSGALVLGAALDGVTIGIADLPDLVLGRTLGSAILIDRDAAGHGWFIDDTPDNDSEFRRRLDSDALQATNGGVAQGRVDLLTAVMHELGHVVGLDHVEGDGPDLMSTSLATGLRLLPQDGVRIGSATATAEPRGGDQKKNIQTRLFLEEVNTFVDLDEARLLQRIYTRLEASDFAEDDDDDNGEDITRDSEEGAFGAEGENGPGAETAGENTLIDDEWSLDTGLSSGLSVNWQGRFSGFGLNG